MRQVSQGTSAVEQGLQGDEAHEELLDGLSDAIDRLDPVPASVLAEACALFETRPRARVANSSCSCQRSS